MSFRRPLTGNFSLRPFEAAEPPRESRLPRDMVKRFMNHDPDQTTLTVGDGEQAINLVDPIKVKHLAYPYRSTLARTRIQETDDEASVTVIPSSFMRRVAARAIYHRPSRLKVSAKKLQQPNK